MATILEGLNKLSGALGGAETATENLEALNAIAGALGGETTATNNADAIDQIAEHASGGGGSSDFSTATVTIGFSGKNTTGAVAQCGATLVLPNLGTPTNKKTLSAIYYWEFTVSVGGTGASMPILVPLYQGRALISMGGLPSVVESGFAIDTAPVVTTGDIDQTQDGFVIRGNGTITYPITYGDK